MAYLWITEENLEKEHICCAMSGNQSLQKKEWLKARLKEGLVFYRSTQRGKCFIEYIVEQQIKSLGDRRIATNYNPVFSILVC